MYEPSLKVSRTNNNQLKVEMETEIEGLSLHYTFDNSFPDAYYPVYKEALLVPKDAAMLRVVSYKGKEQVGRLITVPVTDLDKRAGKK